MQSADRITGTRVRVGSETRIERLPLRATQPPTTIAGLEEFDPTSKITDEVEERATFPETKTGFEVLTT